MYRIKPEFIDLFTNDPEVEEIDREEVERLAEEWETTVDNLLGMLEEV